MKLIETLKKLHWSQLLMVVCGTCFLFMSVIYVSKQVFFGDDGLYKTEGIANVKKYRGFFDPSIEFDDTGKEGYLAFTVLGPNPLEPSNPHSHIAVAKELRGGKNPWVRTTLAYEGNHGELASSTSNDAVAKGMWRFEMPSLVYDPDDKSGQWKLFAYRYFWNKDIKLARKYGVIAMKKSNNPEKSWAKDDWTFGGSLQSPPAPYSSLVRIKVNQLHKDLADVAYVADPGAFELEGYLFLAMNAYTKDQPLHANRIIMLVSADHGTTWQYGGVLLNRDDIQKLGEYTVMGAPALIEYGKEMALLVSLGNQEVNAQGAFVLPIANIVKAALRRDEDGAPIVHKYIPVESEAKSRLGGGQADFHEAYHKGTILMSEQIVIPRGTQFVIHNTGVDPRK